MEQRRVREGVKHGSGGFEFPQVYVADKSKVTKLLKKGEQDLVEFSRWSTADDFMHFVLKMGFLEFADRTYPSPRKKTEVPVWFLVCSQLLLRLHTQCSYSDLSTFLKSGSILSRVGFNIGRRIGFNAKNKQPRCMPCDQDTVRKFFKHTNAKQLRDWCCGDLQSWFLKNSAVDTEGVFILDQTHLVVPDNDNYRDAVRMPVDEHGQLYKGKKEEIEKLKWHPCYTLSTLLSLKRDGRSLHYAGYEFGPGNEDELAQARRILDRFHTACGKSIIKLLICDRGYISGEFINLCKEVYGCDVLIPLRTSMVQYQDALAIAKMEDSWDIISDPEQENRREQGKKFKILSACTIGDIKLWDTCQHPLYVTIVKTKKGDSWETREVNYFALCSTCKFSSPLKVYQSYRLRSRVEECFRQIKNVWFVNKFPSPHRSLLEAHVGFILLTYSLLSLYLRQSKQHDLITKFVSTVRKEALAHDETNVVVAYSKNVFGLFGTKEYLQLICSLGEEERNRYIGCLNAVNQL